MSRAGQMQILALNKMVNIKIFEEKLNKPTGKHPRFSQFNAPRIEPGYKWCFSSLSSSSHPFLGEDIIFILGQFSILILLHPYKQLHQCNPRDVSEERERSCCHVRGGQSPVPAGVRLPAALFKCRGCLQRPILVTVPLLWAAWPCQPLDLQHRGDVLLGQNGLILGQRGNGSVLEQYLRKLVSGWSGVQTRCWGAHPWAPSKGHFDAGGSTEGSPGWGQGRSLIGMGETRTML